MIYRLALIALWGAAQTFAQNGCMDPLDPQFDVGATSDDGTTCDTYCWNAPGEGEHLETDLMPRWITGEVQQTDVHLLIQANQKYPITWVSLASPLTLDDANPTKRFLSEFTEHGRVANTPGSAWSQSYTLQQCWNEYEFTADWFDAYLLNQPQQSSMVRFDTPGLVLFRGFVMVESFEDIEDIRDVNLTRWHTSLLQYDIGFRTTFALTTGEIHVIDEYDVMFAIIEQKTIILDPEADPPTAEADVVLFTTVQWPFELANPQISVADAQLGATIQLLDGGCEDPGVTQGAVATDNGTQACNSRYHIDVTLGPNKCDFTAIYTATFDVVCADSVPSNLCPLLGGETTTVDFDLESENVCPTIVEEIHSDAYAMTYKTPRVGTSAYDPAELADGFLVMQRAHFEVGVSVIDHDDDIIEETIITSIDLCLDLACNTPIPLYLKNEAPTPDSYFEPSIMLMLQNYPANPTSPLPTISDLSFLLHPSVFPVPLDSSLNFQLRIGLDVTYEHTAELLEGADGEQKAKAAAQQQKPGKSVQKHVRNIRLGSALQQGKRMMQAADTFNVVANGQITTSEYPDAATKDPAINADGTDRIHGDDNSVGVHSAALRRSDTAGMYTRLLLSVVLAVVMTALAL